MFYVTFELISGVDIVAQLLASAVTPQFCETEPPAGDKFTFDANFGIVSDGAWPPMVPPFRKQ